MAIHCSRDVGIRPGRQNSLSNSINGSLVISARRKASVDFPEAPGPRMTTRFMSSLFRAQAIENGVHERIGVLGAERSFREQEAQPERPEEHVGGQIDVHVSTHETLFLGILKMGPVEIAQRANQLLREVLRDRRIE